MPTRSLGSSVLKWPDRQTVVEALARWARREASRRTGLLRLGYFGSYSRGDWGVGSDLDLIAVVEKSDQPFMNRAADWNVEKLPVPTEILVYTRDEWNELVASGSRFARMLESECVWLPIGETEAGQPTT